MPSNHATYPIVKKGAQYYVVMPVTASRGKTRLHPAGWTRKEAEACRKRLLDEFKKRTWRCFENYCRPVDEKAIWRELAAFRAEETKQFNRTRRFVVYTEYPDTFLRMRDGLANALRRCGFRFDTVSAEDLRKGGLAGCDLILFPGGAGYEPEKALADKLKRFVSEGGGFIGICAGAFFALRRPNGRKAPLELLDSTHYYFRESGLCHLIANPDDPIGLGVKSSTRAPNPAFGRGIPNARKYTVHVDILRGNGPLIRPGPNTCVTAYFDSTEGYAAIVHGVYGRGRVALFSPHPEVSAEIARISSVASAVECGKLLKNAVLHCGGF